MNKSLERLLSACFVAVLIFFVASFASRAIMVDVHGDSMLDTKCGRCKKALEYRDRNISEIDGRCYCYECLIEIENQYGGELRTHVK